jgi:hypothetical protein
MKRLISMVLKNDPRLRAKGLKTIHAKSILDHASLQMKTILSEHPELVLDRSWFSHFRLADDYFKSYEYLRLPVKEIKKFIVIKKLPG